MDSCTGPKESHIYWNRDMVNPPNQQIYRFNGLLKKLESLELKMIHMNDFQLKEIRGVSDVVKNTKQGLISELDSTRDQLLFQMGDIINSISNFRQLEDKRYKKEKKYLESIIKKVKKSGKKHSSYENQAMETFSQLLKSVNEVLLHQGETDEQLEQIKNEISYCGNIEDIHHSKEQESLETLIKKVTQIDEKQMSHENQAMEAFSILISKIKEVYDNQGLADEEFEQIKNQLSSYRNIDDHHHIKGQEYLESISNQISKLNDNHTSFENQASVAYSELLSKFEEVNSLQGATDYQLKRLNDNFSEYQSLEDVRYEEEQKYRENIYDMLNKLDEKQTSFETLTMSSHVHILDQLEEIHTLQGEVIKLFEKINSTIIKLLATLPTGKKISSVSVKGNQIDLHSFINFDEETNMATFQRSDGSIVVVDSRQILAITFPSSL
jgi:chromosome segregation ATPase